MKEKDKIIFYGIIGLIPILLAIYFITIEFTSPSTEAILVKRDSLETVNGVVDSLYRDKKNHNVKIALLKGGASYKIVPQWESEIENGDSLHKAKGVFLLEVYKRNGKKIVLDYRSTYRNMKD